MDRDAAIKRHSSEPLYRQVVRYLKARIHDGTYPPRSALPSEKTLTVQLQVSRPTVRHAFQVLIEEGIVERVPGRGSFVTEAIPSSQRKRTGNVALIGPEMRDSFLMRLITGAENVASQNDYHLILCNAGNQIATEQKHLRDLWEGEKVDGFLIMAADALQPQPVFREFLSAGVPMVFVDRYFDDLGAPFVVSDNRYGGYLATKHLIELGHQEIGFVTRPNLYVSSVAERLQGYKMALEEANQAYDCCRVFQGLLPFMSEVQVLEKPSPELAEYDKAAIREFLRSGHQGTALLACNNVIAVQIIEVCQELELRIPEDIALAAYDDAAVAPLVTPPLTAVRQYNHEMGARAMAMLVDLLNRKRIERQVFLPVELVVRQSCGAHR
jgi:DNA-binding LacI/PurR family transcriptional regulator